MTDFKTRIRVFLFPILVLIIWCLVAVDAVKLFRLGCYGIKTNAAVIAVKKGRLGHKTAQFINQHGKFHKIELESYAGGSPVVGAIVEIVHLPFDPDVYCLYSWNRYYLPCFMAFIALILTIIVYFDWTTWRKKRRHEAFEKNDVS